MVEKCQSCQGALTSEYDKERGVHLRCETPHDAAPSEGRVTQLTDQERQFLADGASLQVFVSRLAMEGGAIVSSACLTPDEIEFYRKCRRFHVTNDGLGYAILNEYWRKIGDEANRKRTVQAAAPPAKPTSEELWRYSACGAHSNRYGEEDGVWDTTCMTCTERHDALKFYFGLPNRQNKIRTVAALSVSGEREQAIEDK